MRLVNLTPHEVRIVFADGADIAVIPPSGMVARVACETREVAGLKVEGIDREVPLFSSNRGRLEGVPSVPGTYITSRLFAARAAKEVPGILLEIFLDGRRIAHEWFTDPSGAFSAAESSKRDPRAIAAAEYRYSYRRFLTPVGLVRDNEGRIIGCKGLEDV